MEDVYEFGPFRLEIKERRLLRDGRPVRLRGKVVGHQNSSESLSVR